MLINENEIETCTGRFVDVMNPDPDTIDIEDITYSLSSICRFNGHSRYSYSVAQHSVMVSILMTDKLGDYREVGLWGLLHDAAEAYIGDIPRPVKHNFDGVREMEAGLMEAIAKRFDLPYPCPWKDTLKTCDNIALVSEARCLMPSRGKGYPDKLLALDNGMKLDNGIPTNFFNRFNALNTYVWFSTDRARSLGSGYFK